MRHTYSPALAVAALLFLLAALAGPAGATAIARPTAYADVWGGTYAGLPSDPSGSPEEGMALGTALGSYFDLARWVGGAVRGSYWEVGDGASLSRRYTGVDALLGPRLGDFRLLAGLSVIDRRDFLGLEQGGGWGWRAGGVWERVFRRVVVGAGFYATPPFAFRRWARGADQKLVELAPVLAASAEGEVYVVVPLGGPWAVRGGYRAFRLRIEEPTGWRVEEGKGFFLGATARF